MYLPSLIKTIATVAVPTMTFNFSNSTSIIPTGTTPLSTGTMPLSTGTMPLNTAAPTAVANSSLIPSINGLCGGNQTCLGSSFGNSCSKWGYCGSSIPYYGAGCQSAFGRCGVNASTSSNTSSTSIHFSYDPTTFASMTTSTSVPTVNKAKRSTLGKQTCKTSTHGATTDYDIHIGLPYNLGWCAQAYQALRTGVTHWSCKPCEEQHMRLQFDYPAGKTEEINAALGELFPTVKGGFDCSESSTEL